jgi:3-keto-disaccharide hydrolase
MLRHSAAMVMLVLGVLGVASPGRSGDKFELEPGFTRLDNGKDLEGWTGKLDGWSVIDGYIHLDVKKAKGDIYHSKTHSNNCIVRLQFRAVKGADSGLYVHGNQLQVRDYPNAGPKQYAFAAKPFGEWNDLELDITKGTAVVKLNGKIIEKAWKIGSAAKKGLGLQRELGDFDFRYIRIKEQ